MLPIWRAQPPDLPCSEADPQPRATAARPAAGHPETEDPRALGWADETLDNFTAQVTEIVNAPAPWSSPC